MIDILDSFFFTLQTNNLLALNGENWNRLNIDHSKAESPNTKQFITEARKQLGLVGSDNGKGIYVYVDADGKPLYIGKSSNLAQRLLDHYRESQGLPNGHPAYYDFFQKNVFHIVYCLRIETTDPLKGETLRDVVERLLIDYYQPLFPPITRSKKLPTTPSV